MARLPVDGMSWNKVGHSTPSRGVSQTPRRLPHSATDQPSGAALFHLAARRTIAVALFGQSRRPGGLDAESGGQRSAGSWRRGGPAGGSRDGALRRDTDNRFARRPGGLAQLGQRRRLGHCHRRRPGQGSLTGLARYVIGHDSADQLLRAAAAGRIQAIGGIVGNQTRHLRKARTLKRPAFSHSSSSPADPWNRQGVDDRSVALCHNLRRASRQPCSGLIVRR